MWCAVITTKRKFVTQGEGGEGINKEFGIDMYILLYIKWINQQGPTV